MLAQLLQKLNEHYPDNIDLFKAIKEATVSHDVLTIQIDTIPHKQRIEKQFYSQVLNAAKEINPGIRTMETELAVWW